jgi:HAD superfamily hydrolase (TIGR01459 family)
VQKLQEFDIHAVSDMIISSGDVTRFELSYFKDPFFLNRGRCFYHLGAERNTDLLAGIKIDLTNDIEVADFILFSAFLDEGEDLDQFKPLFERAIERHIPLICANPDTVVINGDKTRFCAGVFAEQYQTMGGLVHYYGKPYPEIYRFAFERFSELHLAEQSKILAIGDTVETDILGAKNAGIDSALVLTGNVDRMVQTDPQKRSAALLLNELFNKCQSTPTWIIPSLKA